MKTKKKLHKNLPKGFYPSEGVNRATRRQSKKGTHRNKEGILIILGTTKFRSYVQRVGNKTILHWREV